MAVATGTSGLSRVGARVRVVFNPNASGAGRGTSPQEIVRWLEAGGADATLAYAPSVEDLADIWREDDGRRLIMVGGDGTLHAAVNLDAPARDVALIPAGRANNIARCLGIPLDWRQAAQLALDGEVRPIDLIEARAGDRRQLVVEGVSVGFLAQARVRYHSPNSADVAAAVRAGAAVLRHFHPLTARVMRPTGKELLHLAQLFVANLPLYEFGLRVAPQADPTDACLDLVGIEAPSRRAVLRMLVDLRRGTHLGRPDVHFWRSRQVVISTNGSSPIVADSTDLGRGPVDLRALPAALRIVRP